MPTNIIDELKEQILKAYYTLTMPNNPWDKDTEIQVDDYTVTCENSDGYRTGTILDKNDNRVAYITEDGNIELYTAE